GCPELGKGLQVSLALRPPAILPLSPQVDLDQPGEGGAAERALRWQPAHLGDQPALVPVLLEGDQPTFHHPTILLGQLGKTTVRKCHGYSFCGWMPPSAAPRHPPHCPAGPGCASL